MQGPVIPKLVDAKTVKHSLWFRMCRSIITLHGSPEQIAMGAAVGFAVAFTPTYGFQIVIAVILATLIGASRAAAAIPVWITNPFTMIPIYGFTYQIGRFFTGGPGTADVMARLRELGRRMASHEIWDVYDRTREVLGLGVEVFLPMTIGGILLGLVCAAVMYPLILYPTRKYQAERRARAEATAAQPQEE